MSPITIDNDSTVWENGTQVGKVDSFNRVYDGWHQAGKIEDDRYIDQYGRDRGWVSRGSSGGEGLDIFTGIGLLLLVVFIYYLMYLGIKWLIVEGKKSRAHASLSWAISSYFLIITVIPALVNAYKALKEIKNNQLDPGLRKKVTLSLVLSYFLLGSLLIMLVAGFIR